MSQTVALEKLVLQRKLGHLEDEGTALRMQLRKLIEEEQSFVKRQVASDNTIFLRTSKRSVSRLDRIIQFLVTLNCELELFVRDPIYSLELQCLNSFSENGRKFKDDSGSELSMCPNSDDSTTVFLSSDANNIDISGRSNVESTTDFESLDESFSDKCCLTEVELQYPPGENKISNLEGHQDVLGIEKPLTSVEAAFSVCGSSMKVLLRHVVSPSLFYVLVITNDQVRIEKLERAINSFYSSYHVQYNLKEDVKQEISQYCAVLWQKKWYRAKVLDWFEEIDDLVSMFLVDYGQYVIVSYTAVQPLQLLFMQYAPYAVPCKLAGQCPEGDVWPQTTISAFRNLNKDVIYKLVVQSGINEKDIPSVMLFDMEDGDEIDIGDKFMKRRPAVTTKDFAGISNSV